MVVIGGSVGGDCVRVSISSFNKLFGILDSFSAIHIQCLECHNGIIRLQCLRSILEISNTQLLID